MLTEEQFYKLKIFDKLSILQLRKEFPGQINSINDWCRSQKFQEIQKCKTSIKARIKRSSDENPENKPTGEELYKMSIWLLSQPRICVYCKLPESELKILHAQVGHINKRFPKRGKVLEIDRKKPDLPYSEISNLALACYWCNNAKTDTFSSDEFEQIGKTIQRIWENRLDKIL